MQKQEKSLEPLIHSCMRDSCVVKSCHKEGGEGGNALSVQSLHLERTHPPQHLHKNSSFPSLLLYAMQDEAGERTMSAVMPTQRDRSSHFPKGKRKKCLCFLAKLRIELAKALKPGTARTGLPFQVSPVVFHGHGAATHHSTLETPASVTFC